MNEEREKVFLLLVPRFGAWPIPSAFSGSTVTQLAFLLGRIAGKGKEQE